MNILPSLRLLFEKVRTRFLGIDKSRRLVFLTVGSILLVITAIVLITNATTGTNSKEDLTRIVDAVYKFTADHNGMLPDTDGVDSQNSFPKKPKCIGTDSTCFNLANAGAVYSTAKMVPNYLEKVPVNARGGSERNTGYTIYKDKQGFLVLGVSTSRESEPIIKK